MRREVNCRAAYGEGPCGVVRVVMSSRTSEASFGVYSPLLVAGHLKGQQIPTFAPSALMGDDNSRGPTRHFRFRRFGAKIVPPSS